MSHRTGQSSDADLADSRHPMRMGLLAVWSYAAVSGLVALALSDVVVDATSPVFPAAPARYGTIAVVAVAAGLACESALTAIARSIRRR